MYRTYMTSDTNTILMKLRSLRLNCASIHVSIERALRTSGICKKYNGIKYYTYFPASIPTTPSSAYTKRVLCVNKTHKNSNTFEQQQTPAFSKHYNSLSTTNSSRISSSSNVTSISALSKHHWRRRRRHAKVWVPRITIPQPFKMTIR